MSSDNSAVRFPDLYEGVITAHIIDGKTGARDLEKVQAVRIISGKYRLLIMADYAPLLGKVDGTVTFICEGSEEEYAGIKAFYKHQHNTFTLIIDEREETT